LTSKIYDIIIDARPDSKTFGMSNAYVLDPIVQNKLWVPRGFLHGFAVPKNESNAVFQYFCDNVFDKQSETRINPKTFIFKFIELIKANKTENDNTYDDLFDLFENDITLSDKDCNAEDYSSWMQKQKTDYDKFGKIWYVE